MNKTSYIKDLSEIKNLAGKIRGLRESISYADEYDNADECIDGECDLGGLCGGEPCEDEDDCANGDCPDAISQIREIALKGMVSLCKTPEDPKYEVLKQIFNYCDKANKKKNEEA